MNDFRVLQHCTKLRSELEPRGDNLLWCADCDHAVLDLKRLSRSEISRQFESGARVCGIVERGADGRALTADDLGWFGSARRRFLALLLSPAAAALGWAGYGTVQGRVTRLDGTPRRDVRVLLDAPGKTRETRPNAYGYYWFNLVREGQWKLRVILEDQAPFELQLKGVVNAGGTATAEPVLAGPLSRDAAANDHGRENLSRDQRSFRSPHPSRQGDGY